MELALRVGGTPALFDWLADVLSYQGVSDAIAERYMDEHGWISFYEVQNGGCASIIVEMARRIDARQFCARRPIVSPRLFQKAIWMFCAEAHLGICNGVQADKMLSRIR